jgi:hypothetical protein
MGDRDRSLLTEIPVQEEGGSMVRIGALVGAVVAIAVLLAGYGGAARQVNAFTVKDLVADRAPSVAKHDASLVNG